MLTQFTFVDTKIVHLVLPQRVPTSRLATYARSMNWRELTSDRLEPDRL